MINGNITNYLGSINTTLTNYYVEEGLNCEINAQNMFATLLNTVNYSLFCGAVLLLCSIMLFILLEWYKHKKMRKLSSVDDITDLVKSIGIIQRILLFVCFAISAWLLQIAIWGL